MNEHDRFDPVTHELQNRMLDWAHDLAGKNPKLSVIERGNQNFPEDIPRYVDGNPLPHSITDIVATQANPEHYPALAAQMEAQGEDTGLFDAIRTKYEEGYHITLLTRHDAKDIADVIYNHAGTYGALNRRGMQLRTSTVVGAEVQYLQYAIGGEPTPAMEALGMLETRTFLSFPNTASSREHMGTDADHQPPGLLETARTAGSIRELAHKRHDASLEKEVFKRVTGHNEKMRGGRRGLERWILDGPGLTALAGSGTGDKPDKDDPETILMGGLGPGTAELLALPNNLIVPIASVYGPDVDATALYLTEEPIALRNPEQAHEVMHMLADAMARIDPRYQYRYIEPDAA